MPPEPMVIEFTYADDDVSQPLNAPEQVKINGQDYILGYDENGNMIAGYNFTSPASVLQRDIDFNSANMPLTVTNGAAQVGFRYDADGRRVLKTATGSSTLYFDNNFEVINGTPTRCVFAGNLRIAKVTPTDVEYYHKDHLGSSTAMTGGTGLKTSGMAYLPYGMQRGTEEITSTGYTFTDQELDDSTGLYNYDARLYDPVVGQFLSADSIVPGFYNPQSLNRFSYCYNNPLVFIDPSGHLPGAIELAASESEGKDWWEGTPDGGDDSSGSESDSQSPRDTWMITINNTGNSWAVEKTIWNSSGYRKSTAADIVERQAVNTLNSYESSLYDIAKLNYNELNYSWGDIGYNAVNSVMSLTPGQRIAAAKFSSGIFATTLGAVTENPILIGGGIAMTSEGFALGVAELLGGDTGKIPYDHEIAIDLFNGIVHNWPTGNQHN
jgi:RHS repeat-associated protein